MKRRIRPASSRRLPAGCAVIIGLILLAAGAAIAGFSAVKLLPRELEISRWQKTPCQVTRWEVKVTPSESLVYHVAVDLRYTYEFNGQQYEGTVYSALPSADPKIQQAEAEGVAARQGGTYCYVNPQQPSEAIYRPASFWLSGSLLGVGGVLILIGGSVALKALFRIFLPAKSEATSRRKMSALLVPPVLGTAFLAVALLIWKTNLAQRLDAATLAPRMQEVPARIIASGVHRTTHRSGGSRHSSHRTRYHAKVAYQYDYAGRTWHSDWVTFDGQPSFTSYSRAEATVKRYPAGQTVTCWVNPDAPWQAVLEKHQDSAVWLWSLVLVFGGIAVCILGWWVMPRARR